MQLATVGLSNHRPEIVAHAAELMAAHDAIFLEEPFNPAFDEMLGGRMDVESYIFTADTEYPEFTRAMCGVLKQLHQNGKRIYQIEPFLEHLIGIHEFFADGGAPDQLDKNTVAYEVYQVEKIASAALFAFYESAAAGSFKKMIPVVKRFARADSLRFSLRDHMRALALAPLLKRHSKSYIEAGQIHYILWQLIQRQTGRAVRVRPHFLMKTVAKALGVTRHLYPPGDILTLRCICHPELEDPASDLLAAKALVYNKVLWKEEIDSFVQPHPHTIDELTVTAAVNQLTMAECEAAFSTLRHLKTPNARNALADFLKSRGLNSFGLEKMPY